MGSPSARRSSGGSSCAAGSSRDMTRRSARGADVHSAPCRVAPAAAAGIVSRDRAASSRAGPRHRPPLLTPSTCTKAPEQQCRCTYWRRVLGDQVDAPSERPDGPAARGGVNRPGLTSRYRRATSPLATGGQPVPQPDAGRATPKPEKPASGTCRRRAWRSDRIGGRGRRDPTPRRSCGRSGRPRTRRRRNRPAGSAARRARPCPR